MKLISLISILLYSLLHSTTSKKWKYSDAELYSVPSNEVYDFSPDHSNCEILDAKVDTKNNYFYTLSKTIFSATNYSVIRKTDYLFNEEWKKAINLDPLKHTLTLSPNGKWVYFLSVGLKISKIDAKSGGIKEIYNDGNIIMDNTMSVMSISSDGLYLYFNGKTAVGPAVWAFYTETKSLEWYELINHSMPVSLTAMGEIDIFVISKYTTGNNAIKLAKLSINKRRNLNPLASVTNIEEFERRNLLTISQNWCKGFERVNSGNVLTSASLYDSGTSLIYTGVAFDTKAMLLILKSSNGASGATKYLTNFNDIWTRVESILKYQNSIIMLHVCNSIQYIYIYK